MFVRIRLDEYMELGSGAGLKAIEQNTNVIVHNPMNLAEPLIPDTSIDKLDTWIPHAPAGSEVNDCGLEFHDFWSWEMGGQIYYFPAPEGYRENKSFIVQERPAGLTENSVNDEGIQARQTRSAEVLTMAQWIDDGSIIGDFWVIDTDGWAYWAAPLTPENATGLLLNRVTQIVQPEEDYFYGINVIAQMATKDLDTLDNYERFGDIELGGWTNNGRALMERIVYIDNNNSNIVHVEPVRLVEDGITRISVNPPLLNGVAYVRVGGNFGAGGYGIRHVEDAVAFNPLHGFTTMPGAHTQRTIFYYVRESTPIGYRNFFTAATVLNFRDPVPEAGPAITIPFVIIPAESERVVFGKSGRVYIHFGNNQFQELIEGATPNDNMILGPMIGIDEIE